MSVLVFASAYLPKLGYEWCALRRVQAIDVIDEAIRMCAEKENHYINTMDKMSFRYDSYDRISTRSS